MNKLTKYNNKRNFNKTTEPKGKIKKSTKKLKFCVQHHLARKDHYDFRLEYNGILLSWAIPKGPSYNPKDKRLAVHVENHPISYLDFEGTIPKGEYGGGTVMLWDIGYYKEIEKFKKTYKKGYLKFELFGNKLKGKWTLIKFKDNNWLLIKEKDNYNEYKNINKLNLSVKTNKTMDEIDNITITNPDKIIYKPDITKQDIVNYYKKVYERMSKYLNNRLISTVRCPDGIDKEQFFKKHFEYNKFLKKKLFNKSDYYYIDSLNGLISEVQMNSIEFHIWGSKIDNINNPDMMVFDLDPDEKLNIKDVRNGVKDLKNILDELNLKSYLKTSGGKGYHIVVPFNYKISWSKFRNISKNIAKLMEQKYPDKYTSNIRKKNRKGKILIDYFRNTLASTSVAPYSLRARKNAPVSMPIKWSELDKIKPNEILYKEALRRLKLKDPWEDFFN